MFTYITTTTVPTFTQLQRKYDVSADQVNWTVALPSLGLSLGPLLASSLAELAGRRVVFIAGTTIAFAATLGAALASDYKG